LCGKCGAWLWDGEITGKHTHETGYMLCCEAGKVYFEPRQQVPKLLLDLYTRRDPLAKEFMDKIRHYSNSFACASITTKIPEYLKNCWMPILIIHGELLRNASFLHPVREGEYGFANYYIMDTAEALNQRMLNPNNRNLDRTVS
jgi:hypothetical protein